MLRKISKGSQLLKSNLTHQIAIRSNSYFLNQVILNQIKTLNQFSSQSNSSPAYNLPSPLTEFQICEQKQLIQNINNSSNLKQLLHHWKLTTQKVNPQIFYIFIQKLLSTDISSIQQISQNFYQVINLYYALRKNTALLNYNIYQAIAILSLCQRIINAQKYLTHQNKYKLYKFVRQWGLFSQLLKKHLIANKFMPLFTSQGFQKKLFILCSTSIINKKLSSHYVGIIRYLGQALNSSTADQKRASFERVRDQKLDYYKSKSQYYQKLQKQATFQELKESYSNFIQKQRNLLKILIISLSTRKIGLRPMIHSQILIIGNFFKIAAYIFQQQISPQRKELLQKYKIIPAQQLEQLNIQITPLQSFVQLYISSLISFKSFITQNTEQDTKIVYKFQLQLTQILQNQFDKFVNKKIKSSKTKLSSQQQTRFNQKMVLNICKHINHYQNFIDIKYYPHLKSFKNKIINFFNDFVLMNNKKNLKTIKIYFTRQDLAQIFNSLFDDLNQIYKKIQNQDEKKQFQKKLVYFLKDIVLNQSITTPKYEIDQKQAISQIIKTYYKKYNEAQLSDSQSLMNFKTWRDIFQHWIKIYLQHRKDIPWSILFAYAKNLQNFPKKYAILDWNQCFEKIIKINQIIMNQQQEDKSKIYNNQQQQQQDQQQNDEQNLSLQNMQEDELDSADVLKKTFFLKESLLNFMFLVCLKKYLHKLSQSKNGKKLLPDQKLFLISNQDQLNFQNLFHSNYAYFYNELVVKKKASKHDVFSQMFIQHQNYLQLNRKTLKRKKLYQMIINLELYVINQKINKNFKILDQKNYQQRKKVLSQIQNTFQPKLHELIPNFDLRQIFEVITHFYSNWKSLKQESILILLDFFANKGQIAIYVHFIKSILQRNRHNDKISLKNGNQNSDPFYQQQFIQKIQSNLNQLYKNTLIDSSNINWIITQSLLCSILNMFAHGYYHLHHSLVIKFTKIIKNSYIKLFQKPIFSVFNLRNFIYNMGSLNYYFQQSQGNKENNFYQINFVNDHIIKLMNKYLQSFYLYNKLPLIRAYHFYEKQQYIGTPQNKITSQQIHKDILIYLRSFVYYNFRQSITIQRDNLIGITNVRSFAKFITQSYFNVDVIYLKNLRIKQVIDLALLLRFDWKIYQHKIQEIKIFIENLIKQNKQNLKIINQPQKYSEKTQQLVSRRDIMLLLNSYNVHTISKSLASLKGKMFTNSNSEQQSISMELKIKRQVFDSLNSLFYFGLQNKIITYTDEVYGKLKLQKILSDIKILQQKLLTSQKILQNHNNVNLKKVSSYQKIKKYKQTSFFLNLKTTSPSQKLQQVQKKQKIFKNCNLNPQRIQQKQIKSSKKVHFLWKNKKQK